MTHRYFPHTSDDIDRMLARCGVASLDDLYADIPESILLGRPYDLPEEKSEKEVRDFFNALGDRCDKLTCFAGAGFYDHYAPAVVSAMVSRSEFLTAYTPYQPEISQGTLQYIFEFQSMMTQLTGLDVSNASMYDGTTATAEAMLMAVAASRKRNRVLVSATLNPAVRRVVDTYALYHGVKVDTVPATDAGVTDLQQLYSMLDDADVAGVILPTPNFNGIVEDYTDVADKCHAHKTLLIFNCVAADLAVLRSPGEWGADIACGDAQSLGMPLSYGGPYLGFICCRKELIRKLPGRIVGATVDAEGRRVFVLTLQAREQHIRRDKATSNICSNQGLMALYTAIYLSVMGADGLREAAMSGYDGAHALAAMLCETGKVRLTYPDSPFFNEFSLTFRHGTDIDAFIRICVGKGILPGVKTGPDTLLVAVTEMQTLADFETLRDTLAAI